MKRVIIESPYGSDDPEIVKRNEKFLFECAKDCLSRGESPFASHGWYTRFLDDRNMADRALGITCGFYWMEVCDYVVAYDDYGITPGMKKGIKNALSLGKSLIMRNLAKTKAERGIQ